ncbi:helix-turn-helix domain-containing protein [Sphingobacterium spiritivorum]|uniref:helix-turn-helix domain-containing protein n=1 Tax=Sphingobacterium spiritivorum TaxID=258 RepID=UPI003DA2DC85
MKLLNTKTRTLNYDHQDYGIRLINPYTPYELIPEHEGYLVVIAIKEGCSISAGNHKLILKERDSTIIRLDDTHIKVSSRHPDAQCLTLLYKPSYLKHMDITDQCILHIDAGIRKVEKMESEVASRTYIKAVDLIRVQATHTLLPAFYKSKSLYILSSLMDGIQRMVSSKPAELREADIEKIKKVKYIIETNLNKNFTIQHLAREVGTNVQYLKQHFKQYYGKTIFSFISECKMQKAQHLLKERELTISFISHQLGYKHASHFTNAFKKFFGYVPNTIRYSLILFYNEIISITELGLV